MTAQIIPTRTDGRAHYSRMIVLDGLLFIFKFDYNARDKHWYVTIKNANNECIQGLTGRKLVVNWNPFAMCTHEDRPPGAFLVRSEGHEDPGLYTLGTDCKLLYIPQADVEAIQNG